MDQRADQRYYEIRPRTPAGETLLAAFPGLRAQTQGGETVLVGKLPDQAALHGVLAQIEALALELLEVRRLPPSGAPRRGSADSDDDGSSGRRETESRPTETGVDGLNDKVIASRCAGPALRTGLTNTNEGE